MTKIFVSPDGKSEQPVDSPQVEVRLKAWGWTEKTKSQPRSSSSSGENK